MDFRLHQLKNIFLVLFLFIAVNIHCQEINLSEVIISIAEELAADESDPEAITIFIERLHELSENPVRINSGNEEELSRLFFLSDFQVKAMVDYIKTSGAMVSIYEISGIPGFDRQTAEMITPFITIEDNINTLSMPASFKNTMLTNLIFKPGEGDTSFLGSNLKVLSKYKFTLGHFSGGFTAEKDIGEKLLSGKPPLPDFLSGNVSFDGHRILKRIIIGDFGASFGQGININTGIHRGLSLTTTGYMPGRNEIRPYTSTDENNFFRGAAALFSFKNLAISLFFSRNMIDATPGLSENNSGVTVNELYKTGLHNTESLIQKKDVVTETTYGANVTYDFSFLRLGFLWSENNFLPAVNNQGNNPEDLFDFNGSNNRIYSFYYNGQIGKILLYGEISSNDFHNLATVQGMTIRLSDRLTTNFLYRSYAPDFHTFHGRGQGVGTNTSNEHGLLGNLTFEAGKHLFLIAGADISYFPWLRYRISSPSMTRKHEIRLKYIPSENVTFDFSFSSRFSVEDSDEGRGIARQVEVSNKLLKGSARFSPNDNLTLSTAVNYSISGPPESKGMLIKQDLVYRFRKVPLTLWLRHCNFNTDSWDSRIYTYENDLLYSFSIPALSGKGCRSYAMIKWEIGKIADLRVKYGLTTWNDGKNVTAERDEVRIQVIMRF